ncbi:MAG TPA: indole-3-glycerol phosphate synthase TrpC [Thermodesulfovibrionales bacterium]|nr:indole-3-glycerol phosphate synthase TrpC [Thermodesulfovibrionales bacterium]
MSILHKITEKKRERLVYTKGAAPLRDLKARIPDAERPHDFRTAIKRDKGRIRFIAEIKKASPSEGVIREDFNPLDIAHIYERKAVDAISVLTEEDFFLGDIRHVPLVKQAVTRPVLRKDFIIDEYQIYESRVYGADAILLIASLLGRSQAEEYLRLCAELGLSVLFEVHNFEELEKAMRLNADIIGINNRDLNTLSVDLHTTSSLKREIPSGRIVVSESGIRTRNDMQQLDKNGVDAVLIGTSLMKSRDIGKKLDELRGLTEQ